MTTLVVRPSQIALFLHCPGSVDMGDRAAAAGVAPAPTENMRRGTMIHEAVACRNAESLPEPDRETAEYAISEIQRLGGLDGDPPAIVEQACRAQINEIVLQGRIDVWWRRSDGSAVLVDIKTGKSSHGWLRYAYRYQLAAYALLLRSGSQATRVDAWLIWADERRTQHLTTFTDDDLTALSDLLTAAASARTRLWPGPWCMYCRGAALCPAFQKQIDTAHDQATSVADPVARWIAAKKLEQLAGKILASMRQAMDSMPEDDLMRHGIRRVVRETSEVRGVTRDGILVLIDRLGERAGDVISVSMPKLIETLAALGESEADLAAANLLAKAGADIRMKAIISYTLAHEDASIHHHRPSGNGGKQAGVPDTET